VRIARIVAGAELDGVDLQRPKFLENRGQRKLRQQGREHSNAHNDFYLPGSQVIIADYCGIKDFLKSHELGFGCQSIAVTSVIAANHQVLVE
jgi:hypothetical protein